MGRPFESQRKRPPAGAAAFVARSRLGYRKDAFGRVERSEIALTVGWNGAVGALTTARVVAQTQTLETAQRSARFGYDSERQIVRITYAIAAFVFFGLMLAVALRMKPNPTPTRPSIAPVVPQPSTVELPREPPFGPLKMPDSELPCDVDQVLADKCRRCHGSPSRNGAPLV